MEEEQICSCGKSIRAGLSPNQMQTAFVNHRVLFAPLLIDPGKAEELLAAVDKEHQWMGPGEMKSLVEQYKEDKELGAVVRVPIMEMDDTEIEQKGTG